MPWYSSLPSKVFLLSTCSFGQACRTHCSSAHMDVPQLYAERQASVAAWGQASLMQMPSQKCYTHLTHLVNVEAKSPAFHHDPSLHLLPAILRFCHHHLWLRLKQIINKCWSKIHHSKHCFLKVLSLLSSSKQTLRFFHLEALASEPALFSNILRTDNI